MLHSERYILLIKRNIYDAFDHTYKKICATEILDIISILFELEKIIGVYIRSCLQHPHF